MAQGGPASVQIYTKSGLQKPFPSKWPRERPQTSKSIPKGALRKPFPSRCPREAPPAYKSIRKLASGSHFPAAGPRRSRQRTNVDENWPLEASPQEVAQGGPASIKIYTKSGPQRPFPSKWPREVAPAYKSRRKVAGRSHFPASGPGRPRHCTNLYEKAASGSHFPASGPGKSRQHANLYENWPLKAIPQQMAQGGPANIQIYTRPWQYLEPAHSAVPPFSGQRVSAIARSLVRKRGGVRLRLARTMFGEPAGARCSQDKATLLLPAHLGYTLRELGHSCSLAKILNLRLGIPT